MRHHNHQWLFDILEKTSKESIGKARKKIENQGKFIPIIKDGKGLKNATMQR